MRRAVVLVLLASAATAFAPAPLPRPERRRETRLNLNGAWKFVVWKTNGRENPISQKLDVRPGEAEFSTLDDSARATYEFIQRPNLSPPGFEWRRKESNEHYVGSYRMQGDRLVLVFKSQVPFAQRPTDFSGKADYHFELQRR
jgi:uncharacterized protein (TIGR03067 family)